MPSTHFVSVEANWECMLSILPDSLPFLVHVFDESSRVISAACLWYGYLWSMLRNDFYVANYSKNTPFDFEQSYAIATNLFILETAWILLASLIYMRTFMNFTTMAD
jgi:hypothetical protein